MEKISFLKLILKFHQEKKTGVLKISKDQVQKSIYFKSGKIIFVDSTLRQENLGRILVDKKRITEEQFEAVAKRVNETGKRQGEVLVEMGLLSAYDVFEALKDQLAKKILNCFVLKDFNCEFSEGEKHLQNITELPINLVRVLIDGVQSSYTYDVLKEEGGFPRDVVPVIRPENRTKLDTLELKPEELKITRIFDGSEHLFNIVKECGMDPQFVLSTVYVLNALGIVDYMIKPLKKIREIAKPIQTAQKPTAKETEIKPKEEAGKKPTKEPQDKPVEEVSKQSPKVQEEPRPKDIQKDYSQKFKDRDSPIYSLYLKLDTQGYLELFRLSVKFKKETLKKNYDDLIKKYSFDRIDQLYRDEEKEIAEKILDRVVLAFTVLKDEKKKDEYLKMRAKILKPKSSDEDNLLKAEIEMNKAMMFKRKNNLFKTQESLRKAIEYNPNEIEYLIELTDVIMLMAGKEKLGVPKEVEGYLKKAISIDQNNFNAFLNLGIYYKLTGDRTKAINCFNKTLGLNPINQRANAELRLFNVRKEKKPFFSLFSKKPKKEEEKKTQEADEENEEDSN